MNTRRRTGLIAAIAAAFLAVTTTGFGQKLDVTATGTKSVTLNDKVGNNQFTWNSSAPLEKIQGTASGVTGSFSINPDNLAAISGTISAKVSTMKTGNSTRDKHLQSDDWLDAADHSTISFKISSVSGIKVNGNKMTGTAKGTFTLHGVSKSMSIPFSLTYLDASAATKKRASGDLVMIESSFSISLSDYNIKGKDGMIGSKVGETISISAKLFGNTGS